MAERLNYMAASPNGIKILLEQENYLHGQFSGKHAVTMTIWELVKLRVSQLNQCAYCLDMHSKDALKLGEQPERIYALSAWRDMPLYTDPERDALSWAECLSTGQTVSDDLFQRMQARFGAQGLVDLTIAVNAINSWNRIAKSFKPEVGSYNPE